MRAVKTRPTHPFGRTSNSARKRTIPCAAALAVLLLASNSQAQEEEEDDTNYLSVALIGAPGILIGAGGIGVGIFSAASLAQSHTPRGWQNPTYIAAAVCAVSGGVYTYLGTQQDRESVGHFFYGIAIADGVVALANLGIGIGHSVKAANKSSGSAINIQDLRVGSGVVGDAGGNGVPTVTLNGRF